MFCWKLYVDCCFGRFLDIAARKFEFLTARLVCMRGTVYVYGLVIVAFFLKCDFLFRQPSNIKQRKKRSGRLPRGIQLF